MPRRKDRPLILPADTKYVMVFNAASESQPEEVKFEISSMEWSRFLEYDEPEISVYAREFNLTGGGGTGFSDLKAKMQNKSGFDFKRINMNAVIRNGGGVPVAINQTGFNDVRMNEEREINFNWNTPFPIDPFPPKSKSIPR